MSAWFETLVGPDYAAPVMWIFAGLLLLFLLFVLVRLLRSFASGTFVAGGRNRRARLAVMDAAAVDTRRRLVLVRRDDVEHLILIGGPTDVVIEQDIRMITPGRRHTDVQPEALAEEESETPPQKPAEPPRPRLVTPPAPAPKPAPVKPADPVFAAPATQATTYPARPVAVAPIPAPQPPRPAPPPPSVQAETIQRPAPTAAEEKPEQRVEPAPAGLYRAFGPGLTRQEPPAPRPEAASEAIVAAPPVTGLDTHQRPTPANGSNDILLEELDVTRDATKREPINGGPDDISLEEEMSKLLGDLSGDRR